MTKSHLELVVTRFNQVSLSEQGVVTPDSSASPSSFSSPSQQPPTPVSFASPLSEKSDRLEEQSEELKREVKQALPSPCVGSPSNSPRLFASSLKGKKAKEKQKALDLKLRVEEQSKTLKYTPIEIDDKSFPKFQRVVEIDGVARHYYNETMEGALKNATVGHYKIIGLDVNHRPLVKLFKKGVKPNAIKAPEPHGWAPSDIIDIETNTLIISLDELLLKLCPNERIEAIWVALPNKNGVFEFCISSGNHFYTSGKLDEVYAAGNFIGVKNDNGTITYKVTDKTGTYHSTKTVEKTGEQLIPDYAAIFNAVKIDIRNFSLFQKKAEPEKKPDEEQSVSLSGVRSPS